MVYLGLRGNGLIAAITVTAGMGFILFGYDDGVMGGILIAPDFVAVFNLSSAMQGTVTSLFLLGCWAGCLVTSVSGARFGRRILAHVGAFFICTGTAIQASSYVVAQLIVGRIIAGVGLGLISSNVSIWQSETAPRQIRGMLVSCSLSFLVIGQLIAYWLEYGMNNYTSSASWRFPIAFQALLAIILSVLLFCMPESPRWLMQHERHEEAREVIRLLQKRDVSDEVIAAEIADIQRAITLESNQGSWKALLKDDNVRSRRRVGLACLVNAMQPFSGSTPVSYYTTVIFENSVGFSRHMALLMSGFLQIWFLFASFGTWYFIEHAGRRRMFMITATGAAIVMAVLGAMIKINTHVSGIVATVMIFAYQMFYTWGWMGGVWVYGPEILPLEYRTKGTGLATSFLWIWSFVILEVTPSGISNIGWKMYIIFAIFNACFVPIVYFLFPETAGLSLEVVDLAFIDRTTTPVKRANELWKMRKSGAEIRLNEQVDGGAKSTAVHEEYAMA